MLLPNPLSNFFLIGSSGSGRYEERERGKSSAKNKQRILLTMFELGEVCNSYSNRSLSPVHTHTHTHTQIGSFLFEIYPEMG